MIGCTYCRGEYWTTARGYVGHMLMEHPAKVLHAWVLLYGRPPADPTSAYVWDLSETQARALLHVLP